MSATLIFTSANSTSKKLVFYSNTYSGRRNEKMIRNPNDTRQITKKNTLRATIEISFILILFYSNLLMGEFTRSGEGYKKGVIWAILNILTSGNIAIAVVTACFAYFVVEYLRKKV